MAELKWDESGKRFFETGVKHGVLYKKVNGSYGTGVAWNGLTSVSENPSGAEPTPLWADDMKYLNLFSAEDFGITIEAYTYPDEFAECDGSVELTTGLKAGQQNRATFGFCYTTAIGNDEDGDDHGYKIHLVYGCKAAPSQRQYQTINDTPEAMTFSWEVSTTPEKVTGAKATACLTIDSTKFVSDAQQTKLQNLKNKLFGTASAAPTLPLPDEVKSILAP